MSNYVFVLDTNKQPCKPVHPADARGMLSRGEAAVFRRYPFTIILKRESKEKVEPSLQIKIDPGSRVTGLAVLDGNKVIWGAELQHRGLYIKSRLDARRSLRRNRRYRKTRYRPARFLNRTKPKGWLAPSLMHRVLTTMTWVKKIIRFAPVQSLVQELVRFDLQKLENPEISGIEYQQGELVGYEVREYLLEKWNRQCVYCGKQDTRLEVEHIHPRSKGGTNRISNLTIACHDCNQKKESRDISDFLSGKPNLLRRIMAQTKRSLRDAAAVNSTRWKLFNALKETGLPVSVGSGGQTKYNRRRLGLSKTHWIDAACVGSIDHIKLCTSKPLMIKSTGHGTRQMCRTDKFGFPSRYVPQFKFVKGFQTGDIVKAIVTKGKKIGTYIGRVAVRINGQFNIDKVQCVGYKYCSLVHFKDGYAYLC